MAKKHKAYRENKKLKQLMTRTGEMVEGAVFGRLSRSVR